jgi:hypothetical protein
MALSQCNLCDTPLAAEPLRHCPQCDTDDRGRVCLTMGRRQQLDPPTNVESPLIKFRRALPHPDYPAGTQIQLLNRPAPFRNE